MRILREQQRKGNIMNGDATRGFAFNLAVMRMTVHSYGSSVSVNYLR